MDAEPSSQPRQRLADLDDAPIQVSPFLRGAKDASGAHGFVWTELETKADLQISTPLIQVALVELACMDSFSADSARRLIADRANISSEDALGIIEIMLRRGVFRRVDELPTWLDAMQEHWRRHGWEDAFDFHLATRDYPFLDYSEDGYSLDRAAMAKYGDESPRPPNVKAQSNHPLIQLAERGSQSERVLTHDEWMGVFSFEPLGVPGDLVEDLSYILTVAAKQVGEKLWPGQGSFMLKHVPSGGARHPTEVYVAAAAACVVPPGWYHYRPAEHGLDPLVRYPDVQRAQQFLDDVIFDLGSRCPFVPSAALLLSSRVERSMWRYRHARSYRAVLMDLGHVINAVRISAAATGRRVWVAQGIDEGALDHVLAVNPATEPFYYALVVE